MPSADNCLHIYFIGDVSMISLYFKQDSAPAHCARYAIELLWRTTPDLIAPDMWPLNSPDLNPVYYAIWSIIQQRVYETRDHDIDELRQRLLHVWCSLEQSLIDDTVDQWPAHFLTINLFSLYLMNLLFHTMLDAAGDVLGVHYKSMKCRLWNNIWA